MIFENIGLAISSLKANKMRALLTMLGIIIGITSVITIVTLGNTMQADIDTKLSDFGTNNVYITLEQKSTRAGGMVSADDFSSEDIANGIAGNYGEQKVPDSSDLISSDEIADLQAAFPERISDVILSAAMGPAKAQDGELYANVNVVGVNEGYAAANDIDILNGGFITKNDVKNTTDACVVSDKLVRNMFGAGSADPIGRTVRVYFDSVGSADQPGFKRGRIRTYTIIGVFKYKKSGLTQGTSSERDITTNLYIPVTTARTDEIEKNYSNLQVLAADSGDVSALTTDIQMYFDVLYKTNDNWKVDVSNLGDMLDDMLSILDTLQVAVTFIAGISLLVGGIGVMNIMLVSVTERTREIGVRKALGAKTYHIRLQFVTEAMIISGLGGIIGIILGILLGGAVSEIAIKVAPTISPAVVIGSTVFSMFIGVFFGLYPASKAAKLDPIDALRYE